MPQTPTARDVHSRKWFKYNNVTRIRQPNESLSSSDVTSEAAQRSAPIVHHSMHCTFVKGILPRGLPPASQIQAVTSARWTKQSR